MFMVRAKRNQSGEAMKRIILILVVLASCCAAEDSTRSSGPIFAQQNLAAWCIVPFDSKKRGPEERAEMLQRLGITKLAYDWRDEHIPTFDKEIETLKAKKIELLAWWFPGGLNDTARKILDALKRHDEHPQLWIMQGEPKGATQEEKVANAARAVRPIAEAAEGIGCKVGLYNHGGWFGEPENQVAIIKELKLANVGIVYNFHHGHAHVARFADLFKLMQPHLLAVNINGMARDGEKAGKKIYPVGSGEDEEAMLKIVFESGWKGPVGILCHRPEADAEVALRENMNGLKKLCEKHNEWRGVQ
jgi:hypothetical protein